MKNREQINPVVTRLERFQAKHLDERLLPRFQRWMEDPLKPRTEKGGLRVNPILVLLAVMTLLAGGTFLFFSLVGL